MNAGYELQKKLLLFPITLGYLFSDHASPFLVICWYLLYIQKDDCQILKKIIKLNFFLGILSSLEYILLYFSRFFQNIQFKITFWTSSLTDLTNQLQERPVGGLSYMFFYASFFKLFFMVCILICFYSFVNIDKINQKFFDKIRIFKGKFEINYVIEY